MGTAADFSAALNATLQALTDGIGNSRTLATGDRFEDGLYPGEDDGGSSMEARQQKRAWAAYRSIKGRDDGQEIGSVTLWDVQIEITCSYYTGHPSYPQELRESMLQAANDFARIRGALCWPGNLEFDLDNNYTGLAGNALRGGSNAQWESVLFDPSARVLKCRAMFAGIIETAFPVPAGAPAFSSGFSSGFV